MEVLEELVVRQRQDIDRLQAELSGASESNGSEILSKNRQLEELSQRADQVSKRGSQRLIERRPQTIGHHQ